MTREQSSNNTERSVWIAAGILAAAATPDCLLLPARDAILERADQLGVDPYDIAEYVQWRGHLPL